MPLSAATATSAGHPGGVLALVLAAVLWAAWYALACWVWPFRAHRRCAGSGKRRSPSGKARRPCRGCKGTGAKLRLGRRVFNVVARARREGTR